MLKECDLVADPATGDSELSLEVEVAKSGETKKVETPALKRSSSYNADRYVTHVLSDYWQWIIVVNEYLITNIRRIVLKLII